MDILTMLLVSIPVFYVWGLISFIRFLGRFGKTPSFGRREYLTTAIDELQKKLATHPNTQLTEVLHAYQEELKKLPAAQVVQEQITAPVQLAPPLTQPAPAAQQTTPHTDASLQNWYKDNSINLLLYIGAFLIIVSATIFVSLPGPGIAKGAVLSLLTAIFLFAGLWFHSMPRIKNAGAAFTAIGALLIPVTGLGWYNFVLKYTDTSFGLVWLATSLVGFAIYIILARYFKSIFYSYITSFSSLSFFLAFINMQGLQNDFYVLGAILSSILLLSVSMYLRKNKKDEAIFLEPFAITANITLPIAIVYGLYLISQTPLFTLQATASVFLGCVFYILSYKYFKKSEYIFAAQILFTLGLIYFGFWQQLSTLAVLYLLMASISINLFLIIYFQKHNRQQQAAAGALFTIVKAVIIFVYAQTADIDPFHLLIFALLTMGIGLVLALLRKNVSYVGLTAIFLAVALYVLLMEILHLDNQPYVLGLFYTVMATGWYVLAVYYKTQKSYVTVYGLSCMLFFFLSTLFIADSWRYQVFNATTMAVVVFSASYRFKKKDLIYLANVLVAFAEYTVLQLLNVHIEFYPLVFVSLAFDFYLLNEAFTSAPKEQFRNSGLLGSLLAPVFFGYYAYGVSFDYPYTPNHTLELYSLVSSYAATLLFAFDAVSRRSRSMGYTASAVGLFTYLWQIYYWGITETQYYTLSIGAYFFVLSYIQRRRHNESLKSIFDVTATVFLMVPTWFQTFGDNGASYALILGILGVSYLVYSITYMDKLYRYAGIAAIVLAVVSQSKWAIIGLAGVGFLVFALYLLIYRKEDTAKAKSTEQ